MEKLTEWDELYNPKPDFLPTRKVEKKAEDSSEQEYAEQQRNVHNMMNVVMLATICGGF